MKKKKITYLIIGVIILFLLTISGIYTRYNSVNDHDLHNDEIIEDNNNLPNDNLNSDDNEDDNIKWFGDNLTFVSRDGKEKLELEYSHEYECYVMKNIYDIELNKEYDQFKNDDKKYSLGIIGYFGKVIDNYITFDEASGQLGKYHYILDLRNKAIVLSMVTGESSYDIVKTNKGYYFINMVMDSPLSIVNHNGIVFLKDVSDNYLSYDYVSILDNGDIYIIKENKIIKYNFDGKVLKESEYKKALTIEEEYGLVVDSNNYLYLINLENDNFKVQITKYDDSEILYPVGILIEENKIYIYYDENGKYIYDLKDNKLTREDY